MAKKTIAQLTTEFSDGKTVSGSNFANIFDSNFNLSETGTSTAEGSLFLKGDLTANKYIVSSSVINREILDVSGSTHFGDTLDDVHTRTGSMSITGSLTLNGTAMAAVSSLNDLSDAKTDNFDLALGFEAGNDMDLSADNTYNVYVGGKSGYDSDSDTTQNVGVGYKALENSEAGSYQVAVGYEALNQGTTGTDKNTAIGWRALKGSTGGQENVAIGYGVFSLAGTGGDYNVSIGASAHSNAHSNAGDTAIGYKAGFYGRDSYSVSVGYQAGYGNSAQTAGSQNVYLGAESGYKSKTSTGNIGVGYKSLYDLNDGEYNIGLGWSAGENITDGTNNILIGKSAGDTLTTGTGNILIGLDIDVATNSDSGQLRIGSGSLNTISGSLATGDVHIHNTASAAHFSGDGSGLTNLPASSAFPFVGDAVITGSLLISGSQIFTMDNDNVILGVNAGGGGINPPTDTANVIIGPSAAGEGSMNNGSRNIVIGSGSAHGMTTGDDCVAIGTEALFKADDVGNHIAIGYRTMYNHDSGNNNIAIGYRAFYDSAAAGSSNNVVIGDHAGYAGVRSYNVVIGTQAMYASTGADYNVCIGFKAGYTNDGDDNIYIGNQAAEAATTGDNNIIIGNEVEKSAADASNEIKIGDSSVVPFSASLSTGDVLFPSTASATYFSGDGSNLTNVSAFPFVGDAVITGSLTISGSNAFSLDSSNVVLGANAGGGSVDTGTDDFNVIIGADAAGDGLLNSGDNNVVIGHSAGESMSSGDNLVIIGFEAGKVNTASTNIFIGARAGQKNTSGYYNTFIGRDAGMECVEWQNNTYIGYTAGKNLKDEMNTAVGSEAMLGASAPNTAEQNTALGYRALYAVASNGDGNVAVGWQAGDSISSGTNNTVIGYNADVSGTGTNQIACGNGAVASGDNVGIWGNASVATNNITVDWTVTSDERIKENIQDSSLGLDFINELKPKTYTRKHPADWDEAILEDRFKEGGSEYDEETGTPIKGKFDTEKIHNGLIAQEVKATMDLLGVEFSGWNEDSNGKQGIQYAALVVPLIKAVQELSAKVKQLENK